MKRFTSLLAVVTVVAAGLAVLLGVGVAGASSTSTGSALPTLTLGLNGNAVTVGGSTVSGAVNITTTDTGKPGEPALVRLNPGISFAQFGQAVQAVNSHHGDLNYLDPYASLVYDGPEFRGTNTDQVDLQAGNYFALNIGGNGTPPHTAFTVSQSASPATLPTPGATVSSIEFGFTGADVLHDGELVRFQNLGFLVHMDVWVRAKNLAAAHTIVALLLAGKDKKVGPKVATAFGTFAGPVSSGAVQQSVISEKPGWYVQACFMDTQDGREHTQLGMERILKIVK
ncbi:MAG: hypothetical protein ACLPTJ_20235 [Solirubrobacteraceae bacterium]